MKHLIIFIIAMFCLSPAFSQSQAAVKPASSYELDGIIFVSPDQPDWTLIKSDKSATVFEKRAQASTSNASVKIIKTENSKTDKDRLANFEALKTKDLSTYNRDSIHFNYTKFKGVMCLGYDGIFKLERTPAPKLADFHIKGYLCPHPAAKDSAVQIEISNYSNTRDFSEDFISISDQFFEKAAFSKPQDNKKP